MEIFKKDYPVEMIEKALDKLINQGYLNDRSFAKSYINNQMITTNKGPYKIRRELSEHRVDLSIVDEELVIFDCDTQIEKINKVASRLYKSNRSRGGAVLRKKIMSDLKDAMKEKDEIKKNTVMKKCMNTLAKELV